MTIDTSFTAQATALVHDNRRLRIQCDGNARTIETLKNQYDILAEDFKSAQQHWREREHSLITERDRAVRSHVETVGLLSQVADLIVQAAHRRAEIDREPSSHKIGDGETIEYKSLA